METLYKRVSDMVKKQLFERAIAIDTEYHAVGQKIDRVFCIAACRMDKAVFFQQWCHGGAGAKLKEIAEYLGVSSPIFICHGLEIAERRAFLTLHDTPDAYAWIDTYTLSLAVENTMCTQMVAPSHSLVSLCKRHLNIDIDGVHKNAMQELCINNCTFGHELEILQYCREDVEHLHDLACALITAHALALNDSVKIGKYEKKNMIERALEMTRSVIEFSQIADRGLPCSADRVQQLREHAPEYLDKKVKEISCKYPGLYRMERGKKVQDQAVVQKYMKECVDKLQMFNYPRTSTGKLSTCSKDLDRFFGKRRDCFGFDLLELSKSTSFLRGIIGKNSWLKNFDREQRRMFFGSQKPYGTVTGRCAPQPAEGFIPTWDKALQGILDPPEGKWLVELDYNAEETFIQAALYHDQELMRVYQSKDIYLYYCSLAGAIPEHDFETLTKDELKEKYHAVRAKFKTLILGYSYGAGAPRLAEASGLSVEETGRFKAKIDRALYASARAKESLAKQISNARGIAFPDGWIIRTSPCEGEDTPSPLALGNAPIQGTGAGILRAVVRAIKTDACTRDRVQIVATVHDAVWLEIDENDQAAIDAAAEIMRATAERVCGATGIRIGAPEIIKHGELWTPEHAFDAEFCALCASDP